MRSKELVVTRDARVSKDAGDSKELAEVVVLKPGHENAPADAPGPRRRWGWVSPSPLPV